MPTIYDTFDYGYDPTVPEPGLVTEPPPAAVPLPSSATVNASFLPPVGYQDTPSCFVWSSTYGLATFFAAQQGLITDPQSPAQQASPYYTYVKVLQNRPCPVNPGTCTVGTITSCLNFLMSNNGTPSMQAAPAPLPNPLSACSAVWGAYGNNTITPDKSFSPPAYWQFCVKGTQGLNNVRNLIAQGYALAYCTWLYNDFPTYNGTPSPYVGNGIILKNPSGGDVGHCMMIIGYDDTMGQNGAVLIQNSFGSGWGSQWNGNGGYIWMAYATFQALAQGTAFQILVPPPPPILPPS